MYPAVILYGAMTFYEMPKISRSKIFSMKQIGFVWTCHRISSNVIEFSFTLHGATLFGGMSGCTVSLNSKPILEISHLTLERILINVRTV